ncbi:ABC transporter ATP-binding protein [Pelagivirga sediminicola]|uniref:Quaternary amine transport ATP-binding protein n=1 Tax=Pelagivirga sediminicola TaxID=2170575 RepID=A0A2T7GBF2_9RHOB|nr:betaine/proline/choline family ABC transporter ATP-binding protein [Pelagivirga sediminicola]PVA11739.1 ABC transporter ATP-binding protein [Pelagivirga sediminicola]
MPRTRKLLCRNVWKIYGPQAAAFLARTPDPDDAALREAGLIGAVRAADVDIREGEIFVIMGLSGSGKSTLVRCLSRLVEPTGGEIQFDGEDLLAMTEAQLTQLRRRKIGMVFQNFALLPHLTVLQNVAFPLDVQGVDRRTREARAHEMIEIVGLKGREAYFPRQLSGGQQQRVGIARSLVGEPEIWFLDEPFSALDPLIRREMQDEFMRLQGLLKKTIVFITHDFDEAIRLADRIAVMKDGRIVQTATPEELVLNPATDYVAEFTKHIPRGKVLTLRAVMAPLGRGPYAGDLDAAVRVADAADRIEAANLPFRVIEDGAPIGSIGAAAVVDVLIGRPRVPAAE